MWRIRVTIVATEKQQSFCVYCLVTYVTVNNVTNIKNLRWEHRNAVFLYFCATYVADNSMKQS